MSAHGAVSQVVNGPELGENGGSEWFMEDGVRKNVGIWGQNSLKTMGSEWSSESRIRIYLGNIGS